MSFREMPTDTAFSLTKPAESVTRFYIFIAAS